jgi:predicted ribosome quality control (RQC) complex YloA/Tae2 family protein
MDVFALKALVDDLQTQLVGARVSKVYQMNRDDILLRLWCGRDVRLFLSTHITLCRIHLTPSHFANPQRPPRFAAFLRAHLKRARLQSITVCPYERVVHMVWEDSKQSAAPYTLVHELTGQRANVLFVNADGVILDALKYTDDSEPRRPIRPGKLYRPLSTPPQCMLVSDMTLQRLQELYREGRFDIHQIQRLLIGVTPALITELFHQSQGNPERFWKVLCQLRQHYENQTLSLSIATMPQGDRHLCVLPLTHARVETFASPQAAAVAFYEPAMQDTHLTVWRQELHKILQRQRRKLEKKVANLKQDLHNLQDYLPYQRYGTLLMAHHLPRGSTTATVIDYYQPEQPAITILLDPRLSIRDNAQVYFRKYRKARNGLAKVQALLDRCAAEAHDVERLAQRVAQADDESTLNAIAGELAILQHPDARQRRMAPPPRMTPAQPYRRLVSRDGYTLYFGKSNRGNDILLRQIAVPDDIWLHAQHYAGAHVLIKVRSQQEPPRQTLMEAAMLAAYYSKGKDAVMVQVIYTRVKHVRKFRGARPGEVRVATCQVLEVTPSEPTLDHGNLSLS